MKRIEDTLVLLKKPKKISKNDIQELCIFGTSIGEKKYYKDYENFLFIPYQYYSTKTEPLKEFAKNHPLSAFEVRITTQHRDVLIAFEKKEDLNLCSRNSEILKKR